MAIVREVIVQHLIGFSLRLARAWNSVVLREGDQVQIDGDEAPLRHQDSGPQSNKYTTAGVARMAWKAIGGRDCRNQSGLDLQSSHRSLEALTTVAALTHSAQKLELEGLRGPLAAAQAFFIQRSFDATPQLVRFGALQDVLEPFARYLVKHELPGGRHRWETVPFAEFREKHAGMATTSGIVEVFGQRAEIFWTVDGGTTAERREFRTPPLVLQSGNSSCTLGALEGSHPMLKVSFINEFSEQNNLWAIWNEAPDNSKPNARTQAFLALRLELDWVRKAKATQFARQVSFLQRVVGKGLCSISGRGSAVSAGLFRCPPRISKRASWGAGFRAQS